MAVRIGVLLPFSGGMELFGEHARQGLELAAAEINAGGGLLGQPLELVYADDGTDPTVAERQAREFSDVLAVVGPFTSRNLHAVVPVFEGRRLPLLYATNYEGGKTGRYFFCFSTVPRQELTPLFRHLLGECGDTCYLLGADRPWPRNMFAAAQPMLAELGGHVIGLEYIQGLESEFTPASDRIHASGARILVYALKGDGSAFISHAAGRGLFRHTTVAYLGLSEVDLLALAEPPDDLYTVVPFVAAAAPAFTARLPGATVSHYVLTHYLALMAVREAVEKAGGLDPEALVDNLAGLTLACPTGPVTMGHDHHMTHNMFLARTDRGRVVPVRALGPLAP